MRVMVKKWGNSALVRLPAQILRAAALEVDQAVDVREEGGMIIIEPIRESQFDIEELIARITPDNLHAETATGTAVGNEVW